MSKTRGVLNQRITNLTLSALLVATSIFTAVPFLLSSAVSAAPAVSVCASGCDEDSLQDAIDAADTGGVVTLSSNLTLPAEIVIDKPITIEGTGYTVSPNFVFSGNSANNSAIEIIGTDAVVVNNLTVDGTAGSSIHGFNIYVSTNVSLNDVNSINNDKSGIVVNGSTVAVTNVTTSGNGWHGINVDLGGGVTSPAILTVNGVSTHNESAPDILIDNINEPAQVVDVNGQYNVNDFGSTRVLSIKAAAPTILTPIAEQYFTSTPIVNSWSTVNYTKGIAQYQVEYIYDDGHTFAGGPYRTVDAPTTTRNHTPSVSEQGGVTIRVRAIDALGNFGHWSSPVHYTYDSIAPAAPSLTSPSNGAFVNGASVTQSWSTVDTDVDYYVYESYNDAAATSLRWSEQFTATSKTATNIANAEFWWRVKAVDNAGNESAWSDIWKLTIDNDAPVATITAPSDAGVVKGTVDIRGTVSDDNLRRYFIRISNEAGSTVYSRTVNSAEFVDQLLYSWDTTAVADGEYTLFIAARDLAGNRDGTDTVDGLSTDTIMVTVDNTNPEVTLNAVPGTVNGVTTFGGTASDDGSGLFNGEIRLIFRPLVEGVLQAPEQVYFVPVDVDGNWTIDVNTEDDLTDGQLYRVVARANDNSGTTYQTSNTSAVFVTTTVDNTPVIVNPPVTDGEEEVLSETDENEEVPGTINPTNNSGTPQSFANNTPTITGPVSDPQVLGDTSGNEAAQSGEVSLEGVNTLAQALSGDTEQSDGTIAGLAWYWWLLIIAVIATLIGIITRSVRNRAE